MIRVAAVAWLGVLVIIAAGCSRRPADMPPVFPCTVTVVDGTRPIEGAQVILEPTAGSLTVSVNGRTDARGVAVLRSTRLGAQYAEDGAPAGTYRALVLKQPKWSGEKTPDEVLAMNMTEALAYTTAYTKALETLPREVPRCLSDDRTQSIEVVAPAGGQLSIDVATFK